MPAKIEILEGFCRGEKPTLSVVNANAVKPPPRLGADGQALWNRLACAYDFSDECGRELLAQICEAARTIRNLSDEIEDNGALLRSRNGAFKRNRVHRDMLAARAFIVRTMLRLGCLTAKWCYDSKAHNYRRARCRQSDGWLNVRPTGFSAHETDCKLQSASPNRSGEYRTQFECRGEGLIWTAYYWIGLDARDQRRLFLNETDSTFTKTEPVPSRHSRCRLDRRDLREDRQVQGNPNSSGRIIFQPFATS